MHQITAHRLIPAAAALSALLAAPAAAQTVAPVPPAAPLILPQAVILPALTAKQANELGELIARDSLVQGLQEHPGPAPTGLSNEALVRAALDHARAVHAGRLAPADFQNNWGLRPPPYDPLPAFADAVRRDRLRDWIAALPPPYAGYDTLVAGLAAYRRTAAAGGWPMLAAGPELRFGASGARVSALRARLAVEDNALPPKGDRFDEPLLAAVRRAQRRYGLNPTGSLGAQTIATLNVPVGARIRQIMANMERWRWLPPRIDKDRVQVNIAAAILTVFDGDAPVTSMKAVTGRPGDETPMLASQIHSIVLNPPWNVPTSIAEKELWPKEKANPGYLKRNGFRVIPVEGGRGRLQQASEKSALGRYKFDFDNAFAVYLHDTPAQAGFQKYSRLASHGCVRLERPGDLAELMLRTTPGWDEAHIAETVAAGKTVRVRLAQPVSVYLFYWTAFGSANGQVNFRDDPYDWDGTLADRIEARSAHQALAQR